MGRLTGMIWTNPPYQVNPLVNGVTYNAAGQITAGAPGAAAYNNMGQITAMGGITYVYPAAGQNNGKITTQIDNTSGEQVTFAYDSLNRLICAAGASTAQTACLPSQSSNWGQQFKYDPFGNLTDKLVTAGSAPPWSAVVDANTNRMGGSDANGNIYVTPSGVGLGFDYENRMSATASRDVYNNIFGTKYAYDAQNKRIWSCTYNTGQYGCTAETYYFYGPGGKVIQSFSPTYTLAYRDNQNHLHLATWTFRSVGTWPNFGGRL